MDGCKTQNIVSQMIVNPFNCEILSLQYFSGCSLPSEKSLFGKKSKLLYVLNQNRLP